MSDEMASNPWSSKRAQTPYRINQGVRQEPINRPHRLVVRTSRCGRDNPGSTPGVVNLTCAQSASIDNAKACRDYDSHYYKLFNQHLLNAGPSACR